MPAPPGQPSPPEVEEADDPEESKAEEQAEAEVEEAFDEMEDAEVEMPSGETVEQDETPEVDLADTDVGDPVEDAFGDAFDGVDDGGDDLELGDEFDGLGTSPPDEGEGSGAGPGEGLGDVGGDGGGNEAIAATINSGAARLAVVGLDDEFEMNGSTKTKEDLQDEFEEVFESFKLGDNGAEFAQEYLIIGDEEVDPAWALVASLVMCVILVVWTRPDGDELLTNAAGKLPLDKIKR